MGVPLFFIPEIRFELYFQLITKMFMLVNIK